jgi:hypothetical protein
VSSKDPSSTPAATPGGNGFEIVCALAGHKVWLDPFPLDENEQVLVATLVDVASPRQIVCERCQAVLTVRVVHHPMRGLFMVLKEKECTA